MKILIAGDFCPQNRVAEKFEEGDFESVLGEAKGVIACADYSIVNFECPVTKGGEKPIEKCGPNLQCSEKGLEAVKWAGFECVTLANNHFLDYGAEGVENTLNACKSYALDSVGGGGSIKEASVTHYKKIDGKTLAIINCCEHEFSIATETTAGSNPLNPVQQYYAIKDARNNADYVLIIVHGGHEHYQLPSPRMVETYRFFVDAGADAVVNHHQHCFSGYEVYKGKPIFYGLGNFCFDGNRSQKEIWHQGYMIMLKFGETVDYKIFPYRQCQDKAVIELLHVNAYDKKIEELNSIINSTKALSEETALYYSKCKNTINNILEPLNGRYISNLRRRHLFPSFLTKRKLTVLFNYLNCESHQNKVLYYLDHQRQ